MSSRTRTSSHAQTAIAPIAAAASQQPRVLTKGKRKRGAAAADEESVEETTESNTQKAKPDNGIEQPSGVSLQRVMAVSDSKNRLIPTVALISELQQATSLSYQLTLLESTQWSNISINLETSDGLTMHEQLLRIIKSGAAANWISSDRIYGQSNQVSRFVALQPAIISKLLERSPIVPGDPSSLLTHPYASAGELLHHMILELSTPYHDHSIDFILQLLAALHKTEFDLDSQDEQGHTMLLTYAQVCSNGHNRSLEVVQRLLKLGASSSVRDKQGRSLLFVWLECGRGDIILDVVKNSNPWPQLGVQVDAWDRSADGRTLLETIPSLQRLDAWQTLSTCLREMQHHWMKQERPLHHQLILDSTSLINDLANIVMEYVDGLDKNGQPIKDEAKHVDA